MLSNRILGGPLDSWLSLDSMNWQAKPNEVVVQTNPDQLCVDVLAMELGALFDLDVAEKCISQHEGTGARSI